MFNGLNYLANQFDKRSHYLLLIVAFARLVASSELYLGQEGKSLYFTDRICLLKVSIAQWNDILWVHLVQEPSRVIIST